MPDHCVDGLPLSEEQIFAALDGDAHPDTLRHMERCKFCTARFQELKHTEVNLRAVMGSLHVVPTDLASYRVGLLPQDESERVQAHLTDCQYCRQLLTELEAIAGLVTLDVPSSIGRKAPRRRTPLTEIIAQVIGGVTNAGSFLGNPSAIGMLGGELSASPRLVLAEADGVRITLEIDREGSQLRLSGTVASENYAEQPTWEGAMMQVFQNEALVASTVLDKRGAFRCDVTRAIPTTIRFRRLTGKTLALYNLGVD